MKVSVTFKKPIGGAGEKGHTIPLEEAHARQLWKQGKVSIEGEKDYVPTKAEAKAKDAEEGADDEGGKKNAGKAK